MDWEKKANEWQQKYDILLAASERQIFDLNEELDALSVENERLHLENTQYHLAANQITREEENIDRMPEELLSSDGIQIPILSIHSTFNGIHSSGNVLSVSLSSKYIASGGADSRICLHAHNQLMEQPPLLLACMKLSAPVLSIAFHPIHEHVLLVATMDGRVTLVQYDTDNKDALVVVVKVSVHNRVGGIRVVWSSEGTYFATGSCDKTVHLYSFDALMKSIKCIRSYYFNGPVEALTFMNPKQGKENSVITLVISVRSDCYLHYVNCFTLEKTRVNMNQDGEHIFIYCMYTKYYIRY